MANKAKRKRTGKARRSLPHDFEISREVTYAFAEAYNNYATLAEDLPELDPEWVHDQIVERFSGPFIEMLLEEEFAQGMVMGLLAQAHATEQVYGKD